MRYTNTSSESHDELVLAAADRHVRSVLFANNERGISYRYMVSSVRADNNRHTDTKYISFDTLAMEHDQHSAGTVQLAWRV